jgi:hypothetical protein
MIKITFCLTRKAPMTREAFQDYWYNKHAPLVASVRETLRIARYVQLHSGTYEMTDAVRAARAGGKLENAPDIYDGVAQLWWNSLDDLMIDTPETRAAGLVLLEDEAKFIDFSKSPLWFGEEKVIF